MSRMMKLGLKLWSTNEYYFILAQEIAKKGLCDFIELFYVPGSMESLNIWQKINIPIVIHAPHTVSGLNPADKNAYSKNKELEEESIKFAESLNAEFVIFHPGMKGTADEAIRQINTFGKTRKILIENKPYHGITDPLLLCRGSNPKEMGYLLEHTHAGFCLDVGHAICAANSLNRDIFEFLDEFLLLNPVLFHLSDGNVDSSYDAHTNLGKGNYPLKSILKKIPNNSKITLETQKNSKEDLKDYEEDVFYFMELLKQI